MPGQSPAPNLLPDSPGPTGGGGRGIFGAGAAVCIYRGCGANVYLHWTSVLFPIFVFLGLSGFHPLGEAGLWTIAWTVAWFTVLWTHELAHLATARTMGVPGRRITLWPLSGLAHLERRAPSPRAERLIAAAGPGVHLLWFAAAGAPYLFFVQHAPWETETWAVMLRAFVFLQVGLLLANLLPAWPLDGAAILRGYLAERMHPNAASVVTAYAGFAGHTVLALCSLAILFETTPVSALGELAAGGPQGGAIPDLRITSMWPVLAWTGLAFAACGLLACRTLLDEARWQESPYLRSDDGWQRTSPRSWSGESDTTTDDRISPLPRGERAVGTGTLPAKRRERTTPEANPRPARSVPAAARDPAAERAALQTRVDELLDRMNEAGGLAGLTEAERAELRAASETLRKNA